MASSKSFQSGCELTCRRCRLHSYSTGTLTSRSGPSAPLIDRASQTMLSSRSWRRSLCFYRNTMWFC